MMTTGRITHPGPEDRSRAHRRRTDRRRVPPPLPPDAATRPGAARPEPGFRERTGRAISDGAPFVRPAPPGARRVRSRPVDQDRTGPDVSALAAAAQAGGRLARPAANAVGAPARSARRLPHPTQGATPVIAADPWKFDPKLDLVFERIADVPPELVWEAWTTPEHLKAWFCPKPWGVSECEIDLRPGGMFRTVMLSPEGEKFPNLGCYLDVVPNRRLIWTDALHPGFRPSNTPSAGCPVPGFFTVLITLEPAGSGTRY